MSGFPCGTTAWYEDLASTTPMNFSVTRESPNQLGAKLSCNIFTFIPTNSIKAAKLRKSVRSASYLSTSGKTTQVSYNWENWYFSTSPTPQYLPTGWVFLGWAIPSIFQLVGYSSVSCNQAPPSTQTLGRYAPGHFNCPPQYFQLEGGQITCSTTK